MVGCFCWCRWTLVAHEGRLPDGMVLRQCTYECVTCIHSISWFEADGSQLFGCERFNHFFSHCSGDDGVPGDVSVASPPGNLSGASAPGNLSGASAPGNLSGASAPGNLS
eukprot:726282-Pelagomonas_calceolata.AAC.1